MIKYEFKKAEDVSSAFNNLYEIVSLLRSPEGCPYDKALSSKDSIISLLDEAYEYLDGFENDDKASMREEIGDIFINAFMALRINEENESFTAVEALNEVCEKLIRRHPHVFGDKSVSSAEAALSTWNDVKVNVEGRNRDANEILDHIPSSLPPLEKNYELTKKIVKMGFEFSSTEEIIDKLYEELDEVKEAIAEKNQSHIEEELGDLLSVITTLSLSLKIRPAVAIDRANRKIRERFSALFKIAEEKGIPVDKDHADEIFSYWEEVKKEEK